ncbi:MAG: universal stress protein [Bacteroidales bacterium]|nr:universal stress protein [Bacteroidales bacterium]
MRDEKHKVLILTDFTQICYDSVSYGLEFCRYYGFAAEILHVESANDVVDNNQRNKTKSITELYNRKFQLGVQIVIRHGILSEVIADEVSSGNFMLIILGTHGKSGFQTLTGSAASKIILNQNIPILVVQNRKFTPIKKILLPIQKATSASTNLSDIVSATKILGAKVDIICRQEGFDNTAFFVDKFSEKEDVEFDVEILGEGSMNFAKQVISFSEENDVDMILGLPSEIENLELDVMVEQLMFNIPQIPVMCCGF